MRILIDRTELMGRLLALETECIDSKCRITIHRIKEMILSLPAERKEERKWQE